jgi:tetratricopeptide (TPR) repeat protein
MVRRSIGGLLVLLLLGSGLMAQQPRTDKSLRRQLRERGLDPDALVLPHAIDDRMVEWLAEVIPRRLPNDQKVQRLLQALLGRSELDLEYHRGHTGTAIETFESGQANCLAFTHLFVGLGRELKLPVYYLKVEDLESFERSGDLVVISGHITAGFGPPADPQVLEFALFPIAEYHQVRPLSDISAVALYYSNRGAERLLASDPPGALEWLEMAVKIDPSLLEAHVNLGVAYRRLGRVAEAEASYRAALAVDPEYATAFRNLATMLQLIEGREEEGRRLLEMTDQKQNRNPFAYLGLGDLALAEGRLADAGGYFRRALNLGPGLAETHAAMGEVALAGGETRRAQRWLKKATRLDPDHPRVRGLAKVLE